MERLFVLKTLSRTQRATKVKKFVGFSLKPLRCRDPALPPLYGHAYSRAFFHAYFSCTRMRISRHAHDTPPRVQHFSAFHWVCLSVWSHLTYGASVRPENAVTYSAGNEGQKICGVFSETAPLQRSSTPAVVRACGHFSMRISRVRACVFLVYIHA